MCKRTKKGYYLLSKYWRKSRKRVESAKVEGCAASRTSSGDVDRVGSNSNSNNNNINKSVLSKEYPKKAKPLNQHEKLERDLKRLVASSRDCGSSSLSWSDELAQDLPRKWKLATSDLLILPETCFQSPEWSRLRDETEQNGQDASLLWKTVADCFRVRRICRERRVLPDELRSPGMEMLYGDDPIVTITNNGIK